MNVYMSTHLCGVNVCIHVFTKELAYFRPKAPVVTFGGSTELITVIGKIPGLIHNYKHVDSWSTKEGSITVPLISCLTGLG